MMKKNKIISFLFLAAYSAVILILVINHEYWFDEGQAWNIARDNSAAGIFAMVKYEGHPPLWHFILKIFTALGCSWRALGLISWVMASAAAGVIIFALPIKSYLKAALLFSSCMLYTNTVISRVYVLIILILTVIAAVYPHRRKHPILFGLLVALLTNTHICMSGLVGIIGIYMLIDCFKGFKENNVKQNILNISGLIIAGAGVIVMIIPMLHSFSSNVYAAEKTYTLQEMASSFASAFSKVTESGCAPNLPPLINFIATAVVQLLLICMYIFIRNNRKALIIELIYTLFYLAVTGVIWYTTPNRGALFLFTLVIIYVMCREEPMINSSNNQKAVSGSKKLIKWLKIMDMNADKTVSVLLASALLISAPSGIIYAVNDLYKEFTPFKAAAKFIEENIPKDALLVSESDTYSALLTYLPERKIYALDYGRYYTYCSHEKLTEKADMNEFLELAADYDEIYYIGLAVFDEDESALYTNTNSMTFVVGDQTIAIYKAAPEKLAEHFQLSAPDADRLGSI